MNHYPKMMAIICELNKEKKMYDFEDVNRILTEMSNHDIIEPIDDTTVQSDFYDWADVVGILDEIDENVEFK